MAGHADAERQLSDDCSRAVWRLHRNEMASATRCSGSACISLMSLANVGSLEVSLLRVSELGLVKEMRQW